MEDELQTTVISAMDDNNSSSSGPASPPMMPLNSPGSSVSVSSSKLKEDYSELLKSALDSSPGLGALLSTLQGSMTDFGAATGSKESLRSSKHKSLNENRNNDRNRNHDSVSDSSTNSQDNILDAMRCRLAGWMDDLRDKIMKEMEKALCDSNQCQKDEFKKTTKCYVSEKSSLKKEVNNLTERLNDLECSLRQKNTLVKNMTDNICCQKKKLDQAKCFYAWKTECADKDRECFTEKLAAEHHNKKLAQGVLKAWHGVIQSKWRCRVERQCQTQAKSLCMNLSTDYEVKVCMLNEKIQSLEEKVCLLQQEREMYSEQVKKAFMRGMCALNVETMSILTEADGCQDQPRSMPPSNTYEEEVTYSNTQPVSRVPSKSLPNGSSQTGLRTTCSVPGMPESRNSYQSGVTNACSAAAIPNGSGYSSHTALRTGCSTAGIQVGTPAGILNGSAYSSHTALRNTCSAPGVAMETSLASHPGVRNACSTSGVINGNGYYSQAASQTALQNTCSVAGVAVDPSIASQGGGVRIACSAPGIANGITNGSAYSSQTRLQPTCSSVGAPNQSSQTVLRAACSVPGIPLESNPSSQTSAATRLPLSCSIPIIPGQPMMCMLDSEMQTTTTAMLDNATSTSNLPTPKSAKQKSPKGKKAKGGKGKGKSGGKNKTGNASVPLAPPMASVVVERHPSINKQTLGKATAVRYPKKCQDGLLNECVRGKSICGPFQPIAGQTGLSCKPPTNDMCIRVVE